MFSGASGAIKNIAEGLVSEGFQNVSVGFEWFRRATKRSQISGSLKQGVQGFSEGFSGASGDCWVSRWFNEFPGALEVQKGVPGGFGEVSGSFKIASWRVQGKRF